MTLFDRITTVASRFAGWLGPARSRVFFLWLALTGLASLILNALDAKANPWRVGVQNGLTAAFLIGAALIIASRLPRHQRLRAAVIIVPSIAAFILAIAFPQFWLLFVPFGAGWVIVAYVASQARVRREYQTAIKHMRKGEYDDAISVMSELIEAEPKVADHYRFRAELFRLNGKLKRAQKDYQKVIELTPDSGVGYNGLAEVYLQDGDDTQALTYARKAYAIEHNYWVAPYNLGMIEERTGQAELAVGHLKEALQIGVPDSRHRLLIHLWLMRAFVRLGQSEPAEAELAALRRENAGLREWMTIFESEEAAVLKDLMEEDIALAQGLIAGSITPSEALAADAHPSGA